jgi:hypothetical protein
MLLLNGGYMPPIREFSISKLLSWSMFGFSKLLLIENGLTSNYA